jgi:hypothetical protein
MDYQLIERPGVYHPLLRISPFTPAQELWFDKTCQLVESAVERWEPARDPQRLQRISLAVHVLADHLYEEQGSEATWSGLNPEAFYEFLRSEVVLADPEIPPLWPRLYRLLVLLGCVDIDTGSRLIVELEAHTREQVPAPLWPSRKSLGRAARRMARGKN